MELFAIAAILFLIVVSIYDALYFKLSNSPIIIFFLIGMAFRTLTGSAPVTLMLMVLLGSMSYYLWSKRIFGGADMKLMIALSPWIPFTSYPDGIGNLFIFTIIFAIIGGLYGFMFNKLYPNTKYVPFIPVITITYIALLFYSV